MTPQDFKARINQILDGLDPKDAVVIVPGDAPVLLVVSDSGEEKIVDLAWATV